MTPEERADELLSIIVRFMRPDLVSSFRQADAAAYEDAARIAEEIQPAPHEVLDQDTADKIAAAIRARGRGE